MKIEGAEIILAFDRSMRTVDGNGFLHVAWTNISKATVNPYYGKEIPGNVALGLDPQRRYMLLRDPEELERAAPTFKEIPLLSAHQGVTSRTVGEAMIAGALGSDPQFRAPYLGSSLTVWRQEDIDDINAREKCELSCSYSYVPDMQAGVYEGLPYDGIMRNIRANHVALVAEGRAGPDVLIHDSKGPPMADETEEERKAAEAKRLADREKEVALDDDDDDDDEDVEAMDEAEAEAENAERRKERDSKMAAADRRAARDSRRAARDSKRAADRAKDAEMKDDKDVKAMDSAIRLQVQAAEDRIFRRMAAANDARRAVAGVIHAVDSAVTDPSEIYKLAFDAMGVPVKGVPTEGYAALFKALPKFSRLTLAHDAARGGGSADQMFPALGRFG